jgi:microcystin-dependent protein
MSDTTTIVTTTGKEINFEATRKDINIETTRTDITVNSFKDTNISSMINNVNIDAQKCVNITTTEKSVNLTSTGGQINLLANEAITIRSTHGALTVISDRENMEVDTYEDMHVISQQGDITIEAPNGTVNIAARHSINITPGQYGDVNVAGNLSATTISQGPRGDGTIGLLVPPGTVVSYCGSSSPIGWFLCDGSSYNKITYKELFDCIGYTFGGSGNDFYVPDLRGKVALGRSPSGISGITPRAIGVSGGSETHTLTIPEIPAHTHTVSNQITGQAGQSYTVELGNLPSPSWGGSSVTSSTGGSEPHTIMQPFLVLNYIIKY